MSVNFNEHVLGVGPNGELPPFVAAQLDLPPQAEIDAMNATLQDYQASQDATDAAVASTVTAGGSATDAVVATANPDRGEGFVTKLDQRADATLVVLGDSTGTPTYGRWPALLGLALADRYATTEVQHRLYSSGDSTYDTAEQLTPEPAPTEVVVLSDTFGRTAANLVGTMPETGGGPWETLSSGARYTLDGTDAVFTNNISTMLAHRAPLTQTGRVSCTVEWEIRWDSGDHRVGHWSMLTGYVSTSTFLSVELNGHSSVTFNVATAAGGKVAVHTATRAATGIVDTQAVQNLTMSIEHVGNDVTFTAGNVTYTHTLTQAESDTFATGTQVGFWGTVLDHKVKSIHATATVVPQPANTLTIYNGSVGSTRADYPVTRVGAMVPVAPDAVVLNYGHNHTTETPATFEAKVDATVAAVRAVYPGVPIIIGGQNPQYPPTANPEAHAAREAHKRAFARERGFGYLPVLEAFASQVDPRVLVMGDGVHPTSIGAQVWADAADRYLAALSLAPTA